MAGPGPQERGPLFKANLNVQVTAEHNASECHSEHKTRDHSPETPLLLTFSTLSAAFSHTEICCLQISFWSWEAAEEGAICL